MSRAEGGAAASGSNPSRAGPRGTGGNRPLVWLLVLIVVVIAVALVAA